MHLNTNTDLFSLYLWQSVSISPFGRQSFQKGHSKNDPFEMTCVRQLRLETKFYKCHLFSRSSRLRRTRRSQCLERDSSDSSDSSSKGKAEDPSSHLFLILFFQSHVHVP